MNRAERRALGVPKTVSANIEQAEKVRTVNQFSVAVASVMWDCGYSAENIHELMHKIWDRFDSFKRNYATAEDFRMVLRDEAHMDILYCGVGGNSL